MRAIVLFVFCYQNIVTVIVNVVHTPSLHHRHYAICYSYGADNERKTASVVKVTLNTIMNEIMNESPILQPVGQKVGPEQVWPLESTYDP